MRYVTMRKKTECGKRIAIITVCFFFIWAMTMFRIPIEIYDNDDDLNPFELMASDLGPDGNKQYLTLLLLMVIILTVFIWGIYAFGVVAICRQRDWNNSHMSVHPLVVENDTLRIVNDRKGEKTLSLDEIAEFMCRKDSILILKKHTKKNWRRGYDLMVNNVVDASKVASDLSNMLLEYNSRKEEQSKETNRLD